MEATVVAGVEMPVESERPQSGDGDGEPALQLRMLGPLTICRAGIALALPKSRKVRALIACLALAPQPSLRTQLCELLWDVPNDPRGELRWCLSKVRGLLDEHGRPRVESHGDTIRLDLADCFVDAIAINRAAREGIETLAPAQLHALAALYGGDFLDGLEIARSPAFSGWLTAQRRRFRGLRAALLKRIVVSGRDDEAMLGYLEQWLALEPLDRDVHEMLLNALARRGRIRDGEEHLEVTVRRFEAEGLDCTPIRNAWRSARAQAKALSATRIAAGRVAAAAEASDDGIVKDGPRRASIAVMPFVDRSLEAGSRSGSVDGLAHDMITRLAKLRSLFVIAQGTVFALHERCVGPEEAGRLLNVDYVVSGSVQHRGKRLTMSVDLAETRTARIVWAEIFDETADDTFLVLDEIGNRVVASIASEIETIERNRAILKPPSSLDAWEAHHRGLWHMYRFNRVDNERARHFFEAAVRLDPTFARAYAGLSFTRFQNAFQGWAARAPEIEQAIEAAGQSLMADERDPAAHWAMGRALWLHGRHDQAVVELEHAIELSPNFAMGHYALAFVHSQAGDARAAVRFSDHSRLLSPFDPLLFGMLGARAMALTRLGEFEEAAEWAIKAAARPNAHAHILAIAACCLALAGRLDEARAWQASLRRTLPDYRVENLLTAMRFAPEAPALFREAARRLNEASDVT